MSRRVVPDNEPIWRALADPTRRAILDMLAAGPRPTGAIAATFPTSRFTVMEHLKLLAESGLLTTEKRGRERLHHLNPVPLQQVHERWVPPDAAAAASVLLRLADHLEPPMTDTPTSTAGPSGIDVRAEHVVARDRDATWRAMLDLTAWWPACWPDDQRLFFEPRLGGRLGTTPRHDSAETGRLWGLVSELVPGSALSLDGSMGLPGPVLGHWRMTFEETGDRSGTRVVVVHRVLGEVSEADRDGFTEGWTRTLAALDEHTTVATS